MSSEAVSYFPEGISGLADTEPRQAEALEQPRLLIGAEEALLLEVGNGSQEALGQLYRRLAGTVYNVAARTLKDRGEAEDMVHEVFLAIQHNASRFDPERGTARTWVLCMVTNRALNRRSFLNTRRHYNSDEFIESLFKPTATDSEQAAVDALTVRELLAAMPEAISPEQRRTLHMHLVEGHTFREIADAFGMPLNTVNKQYHRACERLRTYLLQQKDTNRE